MLTAVALRCGGSVGIFFLIKKNSVLYLYTDKGTFSTPPYLDSHGEVDTGGRCVLIFSFVGK